MGLMRDFGTKATNSEIKPTNLRIKLGNFRFKPFNFDIKPSSLKLDGLTFLSDHLFPEIEPSDIPSMSFGISSIVRRNVIS